MDRNINAIWKKLAEKDKRVAKEIVGESRDSMSENNKHSSGLKK